MCPLWWIRQITAVLRFLPFPTAGFPPEWGLLLESNPQRPLITCKLPGMSSCWQQHPSRTSQLHTATKMQVNTSPPEWINRAASKYSSYLSFKCFPCHGCFSLCVFLLHQLFRASFGPLQTAFLSLIFLHLLLFFPSVCLSVCPLDLQLSVKFHPGGRRAWINLGWLAFGLSAPEVIDSPR